MVRRRWVKWLGAVVAGAVALALGGAAYLTQPTLAGARVGPAVTADAARLEVDVREVALPRPWNDAEAQARTVALLVARLKEAGLSPVLQPFEAEGRHFENVRVVLGDARAPRLVVGAHYDSYEALPGADDNASGVAVVLELARLLAKTPPPGAVELVFWTLEEPPFFRSPHMGSAVHAKALEAEGVTVTGALSVETVGFYADAEGTQGFPVGALSLLYPTTGDYVAVVSRLGDVGLVRRVKAAVAAVGALPVRSINAPAGVPGIDWSDHRSYWATGVPAVMVTDTAPNRNARYHTADDTPDTLDYRRMAALTEGLFEAVWRLSAR